MRVYYECGSCFLRQVHEAMDLATEDDEFKIDLMESIFDYISKAYKKGASSNRIGTDIHRIIKEKTGCNDPYYNEKIAGNKIANNLIPKAKKIIEENETLENYIKIAIIGNLLDSGALGLGIDLEKLMITQFNKKLSINQIDDLKKVLLRNNKLLYLADNVGEIVFDKFLIEKLIDDYDLNITLAVKDEPILNDACVEDAMAIGLDKITDLVTIGTNSVGIVYEDLSKTFLDIFNGHDLIISKGLGNYEGLTELSIHDKDVFCLLCAKCTAIAKDIGVKNRDMVLLKLFSKEE
ncbi:MAG: ARMT1-like domain-containing protein [Methanobrevibacter sp.]|nr:ARMT1-like domain-containing protein [Candidatus Methanovirga aequatorialis]